MKISPVCIGLDFDNTLITYDEVFLTAAKQRGLIDVEFTGGKKAIRDHIRLLPNGELLWQKLQGYVYGKGIAGAKMFDGVDAFLQRCRSHDVAVVIISHKTKYGHYDPDRVDLQEAARGWMAGLRFFEDDGYAIPPERVYFEETRDAKLARIAEVGCTHFVDDLEEVLTDPQFPSAAERILFAEGAENASPAACKVCPTWRDIEEHVFNVLG